MKELQIGQETELQAIHDSRKSFYKKAFTRTDKNGFGTYHTLFSYETFIVEIKEDSKGNKWINAMTEDENHFTPTTCRHLNEFMLQHGLEKKTKSEWIKHLETQFNYNI